MSAVAQIPLPGQWRGQPQWYGVRFVLDFYPADNAAEAYRVAVRFWTSTGEMCQEGPTRVHAADAAENVQPWVLRYATAQVLELLDWLQTLPTLTGVAPEATETPA